MLVKRYDVNFIDIFFLLFDYVFMIYGAEGNYLLQKVQKNNQATYHFLLFLKRELSILNYH